MHVLVAGGAGYIGTALVACLLEEGHRVTVMDRFYFGEEALASSVGRFGDKLQLVRADIRRVSRADFNGIDALVDLAGISNDPSCELDPELTRTINLRACVNLTETALAAGVGRVVFASSCSVYGAAREHALTETSPLRPVSLYAECKAEAERCLLELGGKHGACVTSLRLATVFGVSGRTRLDLAVNVMVKNAYLFRKITVEGGGKQWRPFVHVRDVAGAIRRTLESPKTVVSGQVFNVGSNDNNVQILRLAYRVRDAIPVAEVIVASGDPDTRNYNVDFNKLSRDLGYRAAVGIDEGIREMFEALVQGNVDPEDRRCYTLRQYVFLADVERTFRTLAIDGRVLA